MAQSSAQRDPSMEEILASIRKIIEEGEEIRHKSAEPRDEFEPAQIGPAANDATRRPLSPAPELSRDIPAVEPVEPDAFVSARAGAVIEHLDAPEVSAADQNAEIDELSLSLDDFMIEIDEMRGAPATPAIEAAAQPAAEAQPSEQPTPPRAEAAPAPQIESVRIEEPVQASESAPDARKEAPAAADNPLRVRLAPPVLNIAPQPSAADRSVGKTATISPAPQGDAKPSMLSQAVEKQVAASFSELTEALAASKRRSLDQIAEEMMRPMLQEWLDNNLPTLVERLVREEIERVARG